MKRYTLPSGEVVLEGAAFVCAKDGVDYAFPPSWLAKADDDKLAEWGITSEVIPDPVTKPAIPDISDRQFFQEMARREVISEAEALAAVKTGEIPAAILALFEGMPPPAIFEVEMLLSGATIFHRHHPVTDELAVAWGMSPAETDEFFIAAHAL